MKKFFLLGILFAACDTYDPDLGQTPFLCGTSSPTCPGGYDEVWVTTARCECHQASADPDPDPGACADDSAREPNETFSAATNTPVGAGSSTVTIPQASICPPNDTDVYKLSVNTASQRINIEVDPADGVELACDILNSSGTPVANCAGSSVLSAEHVTAFAGTYYARVKTGSPGVEGNYTLEIRVQ